MYEIVFFSLLFTIQKDLFRHTKHSMISLSLSQFLK